MEDSDVRYECMFVTFQDAFFLDVKVVKRLVSSRGLAHHLARITKETGGFGH